MPVGEIGKLLQEVTGNSMISNRLKTEHGGLKRCIENVGYVFCSWLSYAMFTLC